MMPIARSDFLQTSFERKMRAYLTAHAGKQHEKHFGWKTFRVLTVTTDLSLSQMSSGWRETTNWVILSLDVRRL